METVTPVSFEPIIFFGGLFIVSNLKVHLEVWHISLVVVSLFFLLAKKKNMILCHTWIFWSHWCWMNYTSFWEMRLCHFCLLWAIYVFYFFFLDTLSLVTPLNLLISLSFLKPLFIVFQGRIWSVCFNVVVCVRIQRRKRIKKKKFKEERKKKKRKKKKKGKVSKRRK